jgi:hypothetical protein
MGNWKRAVYFVAILAGMASSAWGTPNVANLVAALATQP